MSSDSFISLRGVSKKFGTLVALHPIDLDFRRSQVHAVVGENGAGKSTLMNLIAGFLTLSSGQVQLNGKDIPPGNAKAARELGIEMVHQHFMLVPAFTVEENLQLSLLGLASAASVSDIKTTAREFGWEIPWDARVQDLSVGVQQRVEILKTIAGNPEVVIFDEPTAVLSESEVNDLIAFLRRLADSGKIVILIAHKIDEVLRASDVITVLRKGKHIITVGRNDVTAEELVTQMIGERVEVVNRNSPSKTEIGLEVTHLTVLGDRGENAVDRVSFQARRGEVIGIGGVDGNGQLELSEALAGVRYVTSGNLKWRGATIDFKSFFVGFVPQDRRVDGLALDMNLRENMLIAALDREGLGQERLISPIKVRSWAEKLIETYRIKASSSDDTPSQLSGGNQQKVVLARTLDHDPELLIVVNPTRGLDVKAAESVHQSLQSAAEKGAAVVLITTDRDELFSVSHRQLFMSRGRILESETEALAG